MSSSSLRWSICVVLGLLVILPGWLTWFHLRHVQQQRNDARFTAPPKTCNVRVSPEEHETPTTATMTKVTGQYHQVMTLPSTPSSVDQPWIRVYQQQRPACFLPLLFLRGSGACRTSSPRVESAARISTRLLHPVVLVGRNDAASAEMEAESDVAAEADLEAEPEAAAPDGYALHYHGWNHQWCFVGQGERLCTAEKTLPEPDKEYDQVLWKVPDPPAQKQWHWDSQSDSNKTTLVEISCETSTKQTTRQRRPNRNVEQITHRPATTLLLCLNVLLAFLYWNSRVSPSSVAKIYERMLYQNEVWRALTGATAHFEPLHLGFNMTALYSLGLELEGRLYSSIAFFGSNLCLIVWTSAIMIGMTYGRLRSGGNAHLAETSTVGYSGVLFAWMVVTALEGHRTCPVAFFPQMCFDTHVLWGIRWNVAPLVQLVFAQVIMPRASFMGHLAGIACGYALVWNVVPQSAAPEVWFPLAYMLYLGFLRNVIGYASFRNIVSKVLLPSSCNNDEGSGSNSATGCERCFPLMLLWTYITVALLSIAFVDTTLVLSGFFSLLFTLLTAQQANSNDDASSSRTTAVLARGAMMSLVFTIVTDAMATVAASVALSDGSVSSLFMSLRVLLHLVVLLGWILPLLEKDEDSHSGIFDKVLGWVVRHGLAVRHAAAMGRSSSSFSAFKGAGHVLGTVNGREQRRQSSSSGNAAAVGKPTSVSDYI